MEEVDSIYDKIKLFDLIMNGTHEQIRMNLLNELSNISKYCTKLIGTGFFGDVFSYAVGKSVKIKINNAIHEIPVVVKYTKFPGKFNMISYEDHLIISSQDGFICEAIVLFILSKLWYKSLNLHVPFLIGICMDQNNLTVKMLVLEKCGLDKPIKLKTNFFTRDLLNLGMENKNVLSIVETVKKLLEYIEIYVDLDMKCVLPNNKTVYVPSIIDEICIFFIHTFSYLYDKFNLLLGDQHVANVFIHWINDKSICGTKKLNKLKYINYNIGNNKYITIKTNGMIYKIGDIGVSMINVQKDVVIVTYLSNNNQQAYDEILKYNKNNHHYWIFIFDLLYHTPLEIIEKTIIYKIIKKYNISLKYANLLGIKSEDFIDDFPLEFDILNDELYSDMITTNVKDDEYNFTIMD